MRPSKEQFVSDILSALWEKKETAKAREVERKWEYYDYAQDRWTKTLRKRRGKIC